MSNHNWDHTAFRLEVLGREFVPYLSAEGQWRVPNADAQHADGSRFSFDHLHELVMALRDISELSREAVNEMLMRLTPSDTVEWSGGSSAAIYDTEGLFVIWDSGDNPIVVAAPTQDERDKAMVIIRTLDAELWPWDSWVALCNYPDEPMPRVDAPLLEPVAS